MKKNLNMTEKQIIDRLDSINLSLRQKKDLIDIIKDITASSGGGGGGGTSTDKDTLTVLVNLDTKTVTVNDKQFLIETNQGIIKTNNKELYNFLINTDIHVFIKLIGANVNIDGYATRTFNETGVELDLYSRDGTFAIVVYNQ